MSTRVYAIQDAARAAATLHHFRKRVMQLALLHNRENLLAATYEGDHQAIIEELSHWRLSTARMQSEKSKWRSTRRHKRALQRMFSEADAMLDEARSIESKFNSFAFISMTLPELIAAHRYAAIEAMGLLEHGG